MASQSQPPNAPSVLKSTSTPSQAPAPAPALSTTLPSSISSNKPNININDNAEHSYVYLPSRPNDAIAYRFIQLFPTSRSPSASVSKSSTDSDSNHRKKPAQKDQVEEEEEDDDDNGDTGDDAEEDPILLVFVNGLMLPMTSWDETVTHLSTLLLLNDNKPPIRRRRQKQQQDRNPESDIISASITKQKKNDQSEHEKPQARKVSALLYDRYGQGLSKPSSGKSEEHSFESAVTELQELLAFILMEKYYGAEVLLGEGEQETGKKKEKEKEKEKKKEKEKETEKKKEEEEREKRSQVKVIMASHSIGVPLTRLFISTSTPISTPSSTTTSSFSSSSILQHLSIQGHLFLDSNMSTVNYNQLIPDPSSPDFDPSTIPPDVSIAQLAAYRKLMISRFAPDVPNNEGLERTRIAKLVPSPDRPVLGIRLQMQNQDFTKDSHDDQPIHPYLSILAHHPATFGAESERSTGLPGSLALAYLQPAWDAYNAGLATLVPPTYILSVAGEVGSDEEGGGGSQACTTTIGTYTAGKAGQVDDVGEGNGRGVSQVVGASHFIQRDRPDVVAEELFKFVQAVWMPTD